MQLLLAISKEPGLRAYAHNFLKGDERKCMVNLILKFVRREVRDNFYRARRNLKDKSARNLGFISTNRIFVSESLTEMNKNLFNKCLKVRRDLGFKFIWTHLGKIKLRKDERSPVVNIHSIDDIQKIQVNH